MCGRYRLRRHWEQDVEGYYHLIRKKVDVEDPLYAGTDVLPAREAAPRDRMPVVRRGDDSKLVAELRQWGFVLLVDGKTIDKPPASRRRSAPTSSTR